MTPASNDKRAHEPADKPTDRLGSVGKLDDGRSYVRFERHLNHPVERVWAALTEKAQLANWFPGIDFEPCEGGAFQIWFSEECEGPAHVTGTVTVFDPPNVLAMGTMRWELRAADNGCVLVFTDILQYDGSRSREDFANAVLGGWHKYLDVLEYALDGGKADPRNEAEFDYSKVNIPGRGD